MNGSRKVIVNNVPSRIVSHKSYSPYKWKSPMKQENLTKYVDDTGQVRLISKNFDGNLPQIAIKRKDNDSPGTMSTEVVLLNGSWDTSNRIPNIIAEMHNVNIEELKVLQNTCITKPKDFIPKQQDSVEYIVPSPRDSDSGIEVDCSDGNLSWLLNYKIHELPPVPDCASTDPSGATDQKFLNKANITSENTEQDHTEQNSRGGQGHSCRYTGPRKPPFTYTELIEHALSEKGELTVSGIYQWISDHFPFYKQNDDRWKNSVRHNLSINPHFRKGSKAVHGAGHLWTIAQRDDKKSWHIKKQRMQQFMQTACNDWNREKQLEMELATATASILPENNDEHMDSHRKNGINRHSNGLRRQNVEVEYVNVVDITDGLEDFLGPPVTKEQVVEECGLGDDYLITDLNPASLGLNLAEAEIITAGNIYDDLNFQCYELQSE